MRTMAKKILTIINCLFYFFLPTNINAEDNKLSGKVFYNIPTPNADELMRFGNIPVNYHSGTADISIPLYKYNYGGVSLDVRLQYDSSGLPMNRLPGWTGHGWTLIAGGSITRQIIGYPDDISFKGTQIRQYDQIDNFFRNHQISTADKSEASPDMFYFNFLGKSGRFFLGSDGDWKVISDDIIDIQTDVSDESNYIYPFIKSINLRIPRAGEAYIHYPKVIKGFTLVDVNGTKYKFGGSNSSIEYSTPLRQIYESSYYTRSSDNDEGSFLVQPNMFWCADTWMLTSVVDRFGNVLYNFFYERGKFIYQLSLNKFTQLHDDYSGLYNGEYTGVVNAPVYLVSININNGEKQMSFYSENAFPDEPASRHLYPSFYDEYGVPKWTGPIYGYDPFLYAQSIDGDVDKYHNRYQNVSNLSIDPLSTMELRLLKSICVDDEMIYSFHYDYNSRIHLESVKMHEECDHSDLLSDCTGLFSESIGEYKLVYNDYSAVPSDYLTRHTDYGGYYNSGSNINIYWPNSDNGKKGMLTDVIYPTGGVTHFDYEQNNCSKYTVKYSGERDPIHPGSFLRDPGIYHIQPAVDLKVAGLRIKKITNWENQKVENGTPLNSLEFEYTKNGRSSGDWYHVPDNIALSYDYSKLNAGDVIMHQERTASCIMEYDDGAWVPGKFNYLTPLWDNRYPHVGYETVKIVYDDGSYKVYEYQDCKLLSISLEATVHVIESPHHKGILLSERQYNKTGELEKNVKYQYGISSFIMQNAAYDKHGFFLGKENFPTNSNSLEYHQYTICYPRMDLTGINVEEYVDRTCVKTKKSLKYDDFNIHLSKPFVHNVMFKTISEETIERGGNSLSTNYEYLIANSNTSVHSRNRAPAIYDPSEMGEIIPTSWINKYYLNADCFFFPVSSIVTSYNGEESKRETTIYDNHFDGISQYLPKYNYEYVNGSNVPYSTTEFKEYDFHGRLKRYITANGVETQLLWNGYGNLTGMVQNSLGNLKYTSGEGVSSTVDGEIFGVKPTMTTECFYNGKGQVERIIKGNNNTLYYEYDMWSRLNKVRDKYKKTLNTYIYNYRNK